MLKGEELQQRIAKCKLEQQKIIAILQKLKDQCLDRKISYPEYKQALSKKYEGKTLQEWLVYYEHYIVLCEERIKSYKQIEKKEKIRKTITALSIIGLIALITLGIWYINQKKVSFAPPELITEEHFDIINNTFLSSDEYLWTPTNLGQLTSVKISGSIEGNGSTALFLEEFLLFDSVKEPEINILTEKCEAACTLEANALSAPAYTIRIELLNTSFHLDTITYTIIAPTPASQKPEKPPIEKQEKTYEETTIQQQAEIGKPVVWIKTIKRKAEGALTINLTQHAEKIQVKTKENGKDITTLSSIKKNKQDKTNIQFSPPEESPALDSSAEEILVTITDPAEEYEIIYETPAPTLIEKTLSPKNKLVTITGPDDLHYTNILTYTTLPSPIAQQNIQQIKLYWLVNGTKQEHPFTTKDTNNDGSLDTIEWITPQLSNQTFEIILITKALHLNTNKELISDIYDQVKALDNVWSEAITDGEFVRVTFEKNLSAGKDITLFPRFIEGIPLVEIYPENSNILLVSSPPLTENKYNKIILPENTPEHATFDVKIVGGTLELDHIIDPSPVTAGPNNARIFTNDPSIGSFSWDKPSAARQPDDYSANVDLHPDEETKYLKVVDFNFIIPEGSIITGIIVDVKRRAFRNTNRISDLSVKIVKNGIITGEDKASPESLPESFSYKTYGSSTDLWGLEWTPAEINRRDFGVAIALQNGKSDLRGDAYIDHIRISVTYTIPDTTAPIITFISPPTPADQSTQSATFMQILTSSSDESDHYVLLNFDNSLTGWWRMDDFTPPTTINDLSANAIHGTAQGGASQQSSGKFGKSFSFDGIDDYVQLPSTAVYNTPAGTVSVWVKFASLSGDTKKFVSTVPASELFGWRFEWSPALNELRFIVTANGQESLTGYQLLTPLLNNWYHFVATWNGPNTALYIDGNLRASSVSGLQSLPGAGIVRIGADSRSLSKFFSGSIDEILVFNRALSDSEIFALYNANTNQYTNTFISLSPGTHTFTAHAVDALGLRSQTEIRSVTINRAPTIVSVTPTSPFGIQEDGTANANVNFVVEDLDGVSNLNHVSAQVVLSKIAENLVSINPCSTSTTGLPANQIRYTCLIPVIYYTTAGIWTVTASVSDINSAPASNNLQTLTIDESASFKRTPTSLTFPNLNPGDTNKLPNNGPFEMSNIGNMPISLGNIKVQARNLIGLDNPNKKIPAGNFRVGIENANVCTLGNDMTSGKFTPIANSELPKGDYVANPALKEQLYLCLTLVPSDIPAQSYATNAPQGEGPWIISILAAPLLLRRRKKKQQKKLPIETIKDMLHTMEERIQQQLSQDYTLSKEKIIAEIRNIEQKIDDGYKPQKHISTKDDEQSSIQEKHIPLSIFTQKLAPLEALCKYLKENKQLRYCDIAKLLQRDQRTIWVSYKKAQHKHVKSFSLPNESINIPLTALTNKNLTILKSLVLYLKEQDKKSYVEIARSLNRNSRNIWSIYSRAIKKLRRKI